MIVLCKSCRIFHNESNKFSLHFSNLSSIFYVFSKFQQKPLYYWRLGFTGRPLELSKLHNQTLTSHQTPWIERKGRNWVPRPWRRRLRPKLGCSGGGFGQGKCRMDLLGPTTSVGTRTDYSVGPWDYPACATRHLKAWSTRTTQE
jgi:hypothetical protein